MVIVQMGFLSDALDWIYNKILNPAFEFINGILKTILGYLFENVLSPILDAVIAALMPFVRDLIWEFVSMLLFMAEQGVLLILDCMQRVFNIYIGLTPAYIMDGNVEIAKGSMLLLLFRQPMIIRILLSLLLAGFAFCFLCAIFATIKAIGNLEVREDRSVAHVMHSTAKAMVKFVTAPVMAIFLILMADTILVSINNAFTGKTGEYFSLARCIFTISALDAVDPKKVDNAADYNSSTGTLCSVYDDIHGLYFHAAEDGGADYYLRLNKVTENLDIKKIDFLTGILMAVLFVLILLIGDLYCIERIFGVLVLLFVEPFFIATMPLDDGKRIEKWQEMFLGKLFSAYGMVVGMNVYIIIIGQLFSGKIAFLDPNSTQLTNVALDYVIKLIFMIGGGFALWVTASLVTSIISPQVAQQEQQTMAKPYEKYQKWKQKQQQKAQQAAMAAATVASGGAAAPATAAASAASTAASAAASAASAASSAAASAASTAASAASTAGSAAASAGSAAASAGGSAAASGASAAGSTAGSAAGSGTSAASQAGGAGSHQFSTAKGGTGSGSNSPARKMLDEARKRQGGGDKDDDPQRFGAKGGGGGSDPGQKFGGQGGSEDGDDGFGDDFGLDDLFGGDDFGDGFSDGFDDGFGDPFGGGDLGGMGADVLSGTGTGQFTGK